MQRSLIGRGVVVAVAVAVLTAEAFGGRAGGRVRRSGQGRRRWRGRAGRCRARGPSPGVRGRRPGHGTGPPDDPESGTRTGSPLDDLPGGVRALADVGQRPDWSPDGASIAFLDGSPLGDVWTVDVATGETRNFTADLDTAGSRGPTS